MNSARPHGSYFLCNFEHFRVIQRRTYAIFQMTKHKNLMIADTAQACLEILLSEITFLMRQQTKEVGRGLVRFLCYSVSRDKWYAMQTKQIATPNLQKWKIILIKYANISLDISKVFKITQKIGSMRPSWIHPLHDGDCYNSVHWKLIE